MKRLNLAIDKKGEGAMSLEELEAALSKQVRDCESAAEELEASYLNLPNVSVHSVKVSRWELQKEKAKVLIALSDQRVKLEACRCALGRAN